MRSPAPQTQPRGCTWYSSRDHYMATVRIALANLEYPTSADDSVARTVNAIARRRRARGRRLLPGVLRARLSHAPTAAVPPPTWRSSSARGPQSRAPRPSERRGGARHRARRRRRPLISRARRRPRRPRRRLPGQGAARPVRGRHLRAGADAACFTAGPLTFGVAICHEGWRYPETVRWAARHGAQVVFHPHFHEAEPGSYRPATFADPPNTFHEKAVLCRAAENTCCFATVNYASEGSPTTSAVVRPDGTLLAYQPYGQGRSTGRGHRPGRGHGLAGDSLQGVTSGGSSRAPSSSTPTTDRARQLHLPATASPVRPDAARNSR